MPPDSPSPVFLPSRPLTDFEKHLYQISTHLGTQDEERWDIDPGALKLTLISATPTPPTITYSLTIAQKHTNMLGNLHGGCAATLFDVLSSMILIGVSRPGVFAMGGVSRNLSVTYIRPVPVGTEVRLVSRVVHMGRRLALMRSEILRRKLGTKGEGEEEEEWEVCMVSDHEKANTDPEPNL